MARGPAKLRVGYDLLMRAAADAIIELARDRRFVGGTVGVLAVLQSSADGRDWHPARGAFLVPHRALAKLVRGKLRAALAAKRP
jgi:hypothetical protein